MPTDKPWYTILAATVLGIGFGAAAFWLLAFTDVDTGTAFAFLTPALLIVGFITGQAVPSAVTNVLNRASVAAAPDQADQEFIAQRLAKRAQADAQLRQAALPARPDPTA